MFNNIDKAELIHKNLCLFSAFTSLLNHNSQD